MWSIVPTAQWQTDFHHHVSWWIGRQPQVAATFLEELLEGAEIDSWFFRNDLVRCRFARAGVERFFGWRGASHRSNSDQRVMTSTDVGVVCDELLIHDDGGKFNFQPPPARHPFTAVARQVDEESFHAVGLHIHVEGRWRLR